MMVYKWKYNKFPVSAQVAGEMLEEIEKQEGCLNPDLIVHYSRPQDAVLHACFEWNNPVAAEEYRKVQAREILRFITIEHQDNDQPAREIRAFWSVEDQESETNKHQYMSFNRAFGNEEYRNYILETALKELHSFRRKYEHLNEFAGVFYEVDKIEEQLKVTV